VSRVVDETEAGKGRRTPTRKEAEAARKKQMKVPVTRKEQAKRDRARNEEIRLKQREALKTGDEKYLPARERGPVRKFCRDYVDRRWNVAEFLLPFLAVAVVAIIVGSQSSTVQTLLTAVAYPIAILATVIDELFSRRGPRQHRVRRAAQHAAASLPAAEAAGQARRTAPRPLLAVLEPVERTLRQAQRADCGICLRIRVQGHGAVDLGLAVEQAYLLDALLEQRLELLADPRLRVAPALELVRSTLDVAERVLQRPCPAHDQLSLVDGCTNGGLVTVNDSDRPRTSTTTVAPSSTPGSSSASAMP
jgi:hypothetical protein